MSRYEGLFIFPETMKDDGLEGAIAKVKGEIDKQEGAIESIARMGRRPFARPIQKQTAGNYVVMNLNLDPDKIDPLKARLKFVEDLIRVQFLSLPKEEEAPAPAPAAAAEEPAEEETNAVS